MSNEDINDEDGMYHSEYSFYAVLRETFSDSQN